MENLTFGENLRDFRLKSHNPETRKPITQQELGEFLREEVGTRYSGAAVSDWERGKSKIDSSYRSLLTGIIKVLRKYGGIKTLSEANQLLEVGNYRDLTPAEQKELFPDALQRDTFEDKNKNQNTKSLFVSFVSYLFFNSPEEFQQEWDKAKEGPPPAWPRLAVAIIRKNTDTLSPTHFWTLILWVWIIVGTYWLITPSLQFPFGTEKDAINNMALYSVGTFILPFAIGLMVNTKDNPFWKAQNLQKPFILRLYVFQGSYVGFHVAYFFAFFITFFMVHFNIHIAVWAEILNIIFIIIVSYASAQLVPYNLWRAYQRLALRDGWIFFIFIVVGPCWAWFFLEFYEMLTYPILGTTIILISITIVIIIEMRKKHN